MATQSHLISRRSNGSKVKGVIPLQRHKSDKDEEFEQLCVLSGRH
jgi:hypothetical protein